MADREPEFLRGAAGIPRPFTWDPARTQAPLAISEGGAVLSWPGAEQLAWLTAMTTARIERGVVQWDFVIEELADRQIGVGVMLDPPDWGFFGYLGASATAWSYDPFEGAIVNATRAIHTGLPTFRGHGTVTVLLDIQHSSTCQFLVDGYPTPPIDLPHDSTVIPAACLLAPGQRVRIANIRGLLANHPG